MTTERINKAGAPIWERLFGIKIRFKDTIDLSQVQSRGIPTVGDSSIDNAVLNDWVYKYITINDMVEYHRNGISFIIITHKETGDIYNIIHEYLLAWKDLVVNGLNIGNAPLEDLIALDSFATSIYPHACEYLQVDLTNNSLDNWFSSKKYMSRSFIMDKLQNEREIEFNNSIPDDQREVKKHQTLADVFSDAVITKRVW